MHLPVLNIRPPFVARPAWGLAGIVGGGVLSVLTVPEAEYQVAGALWLPGLILAVGLLLGVGFAALRNPASVFRTEHFLLLGLVYWVVLDAVQGAYHLPGIPREAIQGVFLNVALFAAFLWFGSIAITMFFGNRPVPWPSSSDLGVRFLFFGALGCFLLGGGNFLYACGFSPECMVNALFMPRGSSWGEVAVPGPLATLFHHSRYFGYLVLPLAVALWRLEGRVSWRVVAVALLGTLFLLYVMRTGGRRSVGVIVGATALIWVLLHSRIGMRQLFILALMAVGLLVVLQAMLAWRNVGIATGLATGAPIEVKHRGGVIAVDKNLRYFANVVRVVPAAHPHTGMSGVIYMLTAPIPRSIFPGKPRGKGIDLPALVGERKRPGFSWSCSAVCDFYLIGGYFAVAAGGFLFGALANLSSRLLFQPVSVRSRLMFAVATMVLFLALRSTHELTATGMAVFGLWGLFILRRMMLKRRATTEPLGEIRA